MSHPQQHDDPMSDVRQQLLQGLSVLATLGEAGARMAAVGIQQRAAEVDKAADRDRGSRAVQRQAERLAATVKEERERLARSMDGSWLTNKATFMEASTVWRTAAAHAAAGDPLAAEVVRLAQDRIRQIHPAFMDTYDRLRAAGQPMEQAMRTAAYEVWEDQARQSPHVARPHGPREPEVLRAGANGRALPAGGAALADIDAAVRAEAAKLAEHVSPEALDRLQRIYRSAGKTPAADATGLLRQYASDAAASGALSDAAAGSIGQQLDAHAAQEQAKAAAASGRIDLPDTAVDEHSAGQVDAVVNQSDADHDRAGAAAQKARWGQAFVPLHVGMPAEVAGKNPANVAAANQRRSR